MKKSGLAATLKSVTDRTSHLMTPNYTLDYDETNRFSDKISKVNESTIMTVIRTFMKKVTSTAETVSTSKSTIGNNLESLTKRLRNEVVEEIT